MSHVFDVGAFSDSEEEGVTWEVEVENGGWKRKAEDEEEGRGGKAGRYQESGAG